MLYEPTLITEQTFTEEREYPKTYLPKISEKECILNKTCPIIVQTLTVKPQITHYTPSSEVLDPEVDKYLLEVFGEAYSEAKLVAWCESRYDWKVVRKNADFGLFQINQIHFSEFPEGNKAEWIVDWKNNIDFAKILYNRKGWQDWFMSEHCWRPLFNKKL